MPRHPLDERVQFGIPVAGPETGQAARAWLGIEHALGEHAGEHHRPPPEHRRGPAAGSRERRESPEQLLRGPVVGADSRRPPPTLRISAPRRVVHDPGERRSEAGSKPPGHHLDLLEGVGGVLQRRTLGRCLELVLELQPVDYVRLLSDAPPAEVAIADPRGQLDGLRDFVDRQLAQLSGLDEFVRCAYFGLHQANALDLHPDLVEFQSLGFQLDEDADRLPRPHANTLDGHGGVAEQSDRHRPVAEGHRHQDEAPVGCGRSPKRRALHHEERILERLSGRCIDDPTQDASGVLRRRPSRHGKGAGDAVQHGQSDDPACVRETRVHDTG